MKAVYRVIILIVVYIVAVFVFAGGMTEKFFDDAKDVTEIADPTFPVVSMEVAGNEINVLHGYASNLNEMIMRESITPLGTDRTFTVLIDENESVVKKLKYEILDENGGELESDSFIVLDTGEDRKSVTIQTKENLKSGAEYVAKITLITNTSKRIYYYTRLKLYDNGHLNEKLDFAKCLHEALFDPLDASEYEKYFESSKKSDNSTFHSVNIYSDYAMVTYGDLEPEIVFEAVPTITEFYENMASVTMNYVVAVNTEYGTERYRAEERLRFNYTSTRIYLYNYERTMDVIYEPMHISLSQDEFKIGITDETELQTVCNASESYFAFVADNVLCLYNKAENIVTRVFSFRQDTEDYLRDLYDQHRVKIIKVSEEGNVDFFVYGYMNRGEYEGRVGILLYRFYLTDNRIEEQAYLPINSSYALLEYDIGDFIYRNDYDVFYFTMYNTIYAYNIDTCELATIAEDVPKENLIFCEEEGYVAWQQCSDLTKATDIVIMDLEDRTRIVVTAPIGHNICIFGRINNNIVYGYTETADLYTFEDGNVLLPARTLLICDGKGKTLKEYEKQGYFIESVDIGDNELVIRRLTRNDANGRYADAEPDYVMNRKVVPDKSFEVSKRITDRLLTEYYVSLPRTIDIETEPTVRTAKSTILEEEATVRVTEPESEDDVFYAYSYGDIVFASKSAGDAVAVADANVGTVINKEGKLVWERGVKSPKREITTIDLTTSSSLSSMQNCMKLLLSYKNVEADTSSYNVGAITVRNWLARVMKATPVELTGCSLDEVLYYVYKLRPVIAVEPGGKACLITAYDSSSVTVMEPANGRITRYQLEDAETLFAGAGNRFISYLE